MHRGYIKVWRKLEDSGIIGNAQVCQLLLFLMLKASHRARRYSAGNQVVELLPGQFITGRKQLAAELGSTEQRVRTALKFLEKHEIIHQQPTNKFTLITLINWDRYQAEALDVNPQINPLLTSGQPAGNRRPTTKQEYKNLRKKECESDGAATGAEFCALPRAGSEFRPAAQEGQGACPDMVTEACQAMGAGPAALPSPVQLNAVVGAQVRAQAQGQAQGQIQGQTQGQGQIQTRAQAQGQIQPLAQGQGPLAVVIALPLNSGEEHPVTQGEIELWSDLYPAVDVMQALRNMKGWLIGNGTRRKTRAGIGKFIHAWLAKDQDNPRGAPFGAFGPGMGHAGASAGPGVWSGVRPGAGPSVHGAITGSGQPRTYAQPENIPDWIKEAANECVHANAHVSATAIASATAHTTTANADIAAGVGASGNVAAGAIANSTIAAGAMGAIATSNASFAGSPGN